MEKYIFLDFDGVINTQNDKFDKTLWLIYAACWKN